MKVRFGIGIGRQAPEADQLSAIGRAIVELGFDSIWLSEVISGGGPDPLVALGYLAAAVPGMRLGTTMLLPGRNPFRLAKALASLDRLSGGKLLVTFVPGLNEGPEREVVGVAPKDRGAAMDELVPLVRRLLSGERVELEGAGTGVTIEPRPRQDPLEFWLGGIGPRALERCGQLGDGWLPSACPSDEARRGREVIEAAAAAHGRRIDPEHFGVSLPYARDPLSAEQRESLARRSRGHDPATLVPVGRDGLRRSIEEFVAVGVSKFVLRPLSAPADWPAELAQLAEDVVDLQT